ncbi:MAG TPA: keto-deoxy-phosphogluconate aldolase [Alphaproteobacteria bacterium]|nr:keto-deoxy-phosphogluconate aldolase [Alphaproteobacteria bacterium]
MTIDAILNLGPVMPVIVIDEADKAVPLAEALLSGGIRTAEITLRTPAALAAIQEMATHCPAITVGAGTVRTVQQARQVAAAGGRFAVSPGTTSSVVSGCAEAGLPLLPGAATVSEMMALSEQGFTALKFFPATAAGGLNFIKALASPLPDLTFCPTGGITPDTAPDWLALSNIACVGGSWVAPQDLIAKADFVEITNRARAAACLA